MYIYVYVASAAMIVVHALKFIQEISLMHEPKMITSGWLLNKLVS